MKQRNIMKINLLLLLMISFINKAGTDHEKNGEKPVLQKTQPDRKVTNPRTDLAQRMDREFDDLIDNDTGMDMDTSPAINSIETEIFTSTLQLAVKYNKQLVFGFFMMGTLLAVIFPQQTKSVILDTTSKVKKIIHQCSTFFSHAKRTMQRTVSRLLFF